MNSRTKVTGVILAGGMARRMDGQDKGLILYRGRPMIEYAIAAMSGAADQLVINANRNLDRYQAYGYDVITDATASYDGPLAGVLAVMQTMVPGLLLVMPCDSPLFTASHLQRLLDEVQQTQAEITVASDGQRWHPVFLVLQHSLLSSLQAYLGSGQRKIDRWLEQHKVYPVDFSDCVEIFNNINTMTDLTALEQESGG